MSLDDDAHVSVLFEKLRVGLNGGDLIGANGVIVEVEEYVETAGGVGERALSAGRLGLRAGRNDGDARVGFLHSAWTFGGQMIRGGFGGCNGLRSVGLNGSDLRDGNVGCVFGLPGDGDGLALLHRRWRRFNLSRWSGCSRRQRSLRYRRFLGASAQKGQ